MADDHQRGAAGIEIVLQPFDRCQVEMIGRLVEEKDIGRGRQHARERGAARLAAGEMGRIFLPGEAELLEDIAGNMGTVARSQPRFDIAKRGREAREIRLLRQVAHQGPGLHEDRAAVRFDQSRRDFQQGRFARSIAAHQGHALAGTDRQLRTGEERGAAEGQGDVFELEEGRCHTGQLRVKERGRKRAGLFRAMRSGLLCCDGSRVFRHRLFFE